MPWHATRFMSVSHSVPHFMLLSATPTHGERSGDHAAAGDECESRPAGGRQEGERNSQPCTTTRGR